MDTAGPEAEGQPNRPFRARNTAFVARCGRSAPADATVRDPAALAPPLGPGRGTAATVTQALTASVLPQPARKSAEDVATLIRPAGQPRPAPGQRAAGHRARRAREAGPEVAPGREVSVMTSSSQPPDLGRYLARRGYRPQGPCHSTWLDRYNGQYVIRVVREPEEQTQLICLAPRSVCVYQAVFSLGTPGAVIIAAVEAAAEPSPRAAGGRAPDRADHGPAHGARRRKAVTGDDDPYELITLAGKYARTLGGDAQIRIAFQPGYPRPAVGFMPLAVRRGAWPAEPSSNSMTKWQAESVRPPSD